jgi:hypothetical protein
MGLTGKEAADAENMSGVFLPKCVLIGLWFSKTLRREYTLNKNINATCSVGSMFHELKQKITEMFHTPKKLISLKF